MDRTEKAIRACYLKSVADYTHVGLAPPPTVVASGELPLIEAVAQLMTLHEDCLHRVASRVRGFEARSKELGPDAVAAPLLGELAQGYDVPLDELLEGWARRDDPDAVYDRLAQPHLPTGEFDTVALGAECDAEFARNGWKDRLATVDAYATPFDPRLPLVRSRIGLRPEGIAWVSFHRPQNFQVALFDGLRLIHRQSDQWCLEFRDWRRRRLADRQKPPAWQDFLEQVRQVSGAAGLVWTSATEGHRHVIYDAVIYNVAGWSDDDRDELTRSLVDASIPHEWDGSDLRVPASQEKKVDRIMGAS